MSTLKKWFGPSREEVWRQLSAETGSNFVEGEFWKRDKVQASHSEWTITLDVFVVSTGKTTIPFTRILAPFINKDGFWFTIYRKSIFSEFGKYLGMLDIEVGYPEFDADFIIQGTDAEKVRTLFRNPKIRELISAQRDIKFQVVHEKAVFGKNYPENVDELKFVVPGVIKDVARLRLLFDLFAETLDELCRLGSAYENAPGPKM